MMNTGKLRVIYAGVAVALVLSLVACEPTTQTKIEASDKEDVTKNLETTTKAQDLKEEYFIEKDIIDKWYPQKSNGRNII